MILKTQGAKLLEHICDFIDGAVSFLTIFCCLTLNHSLSKDKVALGNELIPFKDSKFLKSD